MRIALLEDNPAILDYISIALKLAGHEVYTHTQSMSLLRTLLAEDGPLLPLPYDMVIVDLLLPGDIDGLAAIEQIQQHLSSEQLPIIVVSACSHDELEEAQKHLPHVPIMRKPFKMSALLQLVEDVRVA